MRKFLLDVKKLSMEELSRSNLSTASFLPSTKNRVLQNLPPESKFLLGW